MRLEAVRICLYVSFKVPLKVSPHVLLHVLLMILFNATLNAATTAPNDIQEQPAKISVIVSILDKGALEKQDSKALNRLKVSIRGRDTYTAYVSHDHKQINLDLRGEAFSRTWTSFQIKEIAKIAEAFCIDGDDYLALADFCMAHFLEKETKRYCSSAKRKDKQLADKTDTLLSTLKERMDDFKKSRYNHDGRKLPDTPHITKPILFNTPEADHIISSLQIFPKDNPWNTDISNNPVHPDSDKIIKAIGFKNNLKLDVSHNFIIVPPGQQKKHVKIVSYPDQSETDPAPIPDELPIEGWPQFWGDKANLPLDTYQRKGDGDRHAYIIAPHEMMVYEFFHVHKSKTGWQAACSRYWRLNKNEYPPAGHTSADAAGLSIFAGIVRYDELQRGKVEHAIRVTFRQTRAEYIYPATHHASKTNNKFMPAMGQRFRLKANADSSGLSKSALAIVYALKKYGAICADNGSDWMISGVIDSRIPMHEMRALSRFSGKDFEVIQTQGPTTK